MAWHTPRLWHLPGHAGGFKAQRPWRSPSQWCSVAARTSRRRATFAKTHLMHRPVAAVASFSSERWPNQALRLASSANTQDSIRFDSERFSALAMAFNCS